MAFRRLCAAGAVVLGATAIGGATAAPDQATLVHTLLPWHPAVRDAQGRLLAWYRPDAGLGYDHVLRLGWRFIERRVPKDRKTGAKVYLLYPVFDGRTLQGRYWQHNPAFLYSSFVDSLVSWFPYSGDRRAVTAVRAMLDYQLAHGTTHGSFAWSGVPFATSCAGDRAYGRCVAGLPRRRSGGVEPSDGYGDYLRSFNWAMAAIPELAPTGQDHVLGSTSVVQAVSYGRRHLDYRTFDRQSWTSSVCHIVRPACAPVV